MWIASKILEFIIRDSIIKHIELNHNSVTTETIRLHFFFLLCSNYFKCSKDSIRPSGVNISTAYFDCQKAFYQFLTINHHTMKHNQHNAAFPTLSPSTKKSGLDNSYLYLGHNLLHWTAKNHTINGYIKWSTSRICLGAQHYLWFYQQVFSWSQQL